MSMLPPETYPHVDSWATTRIPFRFVIFVAVEADPETGPYIAVEKLRRIKAWGRDATDAARRVMRREGITGPLWWKP